MSKLTLMGQMRHIDEKKYISFRTESKEHLLPIIADGDAAEGAWVHFSGILRTQFIPEGGRYRKAWFGLGHLHPSYDGLYANELTVESGVVVRVDELRTTPLTLRKIVDFVVADGQDYYNCIAFGKTADRLIRYKKGREITLISAQFHSRAYTKDGEPKTAYEVCVRDLYNHLEELWR